ncbi:MAG: hypothetical protein WBN10_17995 [Polyangiales bacterium]
MSDYGFNIPPKKAVAISVCFIALGVLRRATDSLWVELLTWAFIIAGLTAIWNWKPD